MVIDTSAILAWLKEETASGARRDRPELNAALEFMRAGDTLVAWKLDRLARSTRQLLETVERLSQRQMGFKTITQDIDTTNAGGRLIFTVFGAIAEFEREIIRERTRAGLDAQRSTVIYPRHGKSPRTRAHEQRHAPAADAPYQRSVAARLSRRAGAMFHARGRRRAAPTVGFLGTAACGAHPLRGNRRWI